MPATSNTPTSASSVEARGLPDVWSLSTATTTMKWVPISPFVDHPQIQKERNRNQNVAAAAALLERSGSPAGRGTPCWARPASRPPRRPPRRTPWCRRRRGCRACTSHTSGTSSSAKTLTRPAAQRQPGSVGELGDGRQEHQLPAWSWPPRRPRRPRRGAGRTSGWRRSPRRRGPATRCRCPTAKPHSSHSCQALVITSVKPGAERDQEPAQRRPPGVRRSAPSGRRRTARSGRRSPGSG